jgi:hypothetical protein
MKKTSLIKQKLLKQDMKLPVRQLSNVNWKQLGYVVEQYLYNVAYDRRRQKILELEGSVDDDDMRLLAECIQELKLKPHHLIDAVFVDDDDDEVLSNLLELYEIWKESLV